MKDLQGLLFQILADPWKVARSRNTTCNIGIYTNVELKVEIRVLKLRDYH